MRTAVAALLLALAVAVPAAAQDNPLGPLPTPAPEPPETVVVAPDNDGGDGLNSWQQALIFGGGLILLGGIAYAIVSDARRRAPVTDKQAAHPGLDHAPKRNRTEKQRARDRAKAKQGRKQRRQTRRK
jgi:hypothetical protein